MKHSQSLKKNADFQIVYKEGKSFANKYLVMYVKENDLGINRIGISVSKKVGNSVVRHRVKRLILESYRLHEDMFNSGLDMVIIARTTAKEKGYHEIESAVMHLGKLQGIIIGNSYENNIDHYDSILSKIFISFKIHEMSLLSILFSLRIRGSSKIWSF